MEVCVLYGLCGLFVRVSEKNSKEKNPTFSNILLVGACCDMRCDKALLELPTIKRHHGDVMTHLEDEPEPSNEL